MRIHILGICGTFMGSLAVLAKQLGHDVSGCDQQVYPPMSTQLEEQGIVLCEGYDPDHIRASNPDIVVIGNTCSRGNPAVEFVLDEALPYTSGPAWLAEHVLAGRHVIGVAGTHGKTTTTSMVSWILEHAGLEPGFLIGGVPANFPVSARLGKSPYFVIEADEYDSAFFDKRSKFIHYRPRTVIMGNLEFDHADIFRSLEDIQLQFHHLVKTVPASGRIIAPQADAALQEVFARGTWCPLELIGEGDAAWRLDPIHSDGSAFAVTHVGDDAGAQRAEVHWDLLGRHNMANAVAAIAASAHAGVPLSQACAALSTFRGVRRRLELLGTIGGIRVYDDFAHHPTAIRSTLEGLRESLGSPAREGGRIIVLIEARSNTMKAGYHQHTLAASLDAADTVLWYRTPSAQLDLEAIAAGTRADFMAMASTADMTDWVGQHARRGDHVVIMSNGGFEGIHRRVLAALEAAGDGINSGNETVA